MKITRVFAAEEDAVNVKGIIIELLNNEMESLLRPKEAAEKIKLQATNREIDLGGDCA